MSYSIQLVSYNILADTYATPQWYPRIDPEMLRWDKRKIALLERIKSFGADIICLQEVETGAYAFFEPHLRQQGYQGVYAQKGYGKPDGCATFFRQDKLRLTGSQAVYYKDGQGAPDSGHLALVTSFASESGDIRVANTHLRWDREDRPREAHPGYRQAIELLNYIRADHDAYAWVVCGDLNARPESAIVRELLAGGFADAYQGAEQDTCNTHGEAKRIDYILHTKTLTAQPARLAEIDGLTPLPSAAEPSDHRAVMAILT